MNRFKKIAAEVVRPYRTNKTTWHIPSRSRDSVLSLDEAKSIADAMSAAARHNALDNTQVHLNGAIFKGLQDRLVNNERNSSVTRFFGGLSDPFSNLPDKTNAGASDAFLPYHDTVFLPSGNPGVLAHELGHAVDLNEFPNTPFRRFTSGVYTRYAPTLWLEHAAWRKGKKRLIEGAPKVKMNPELFTRTLEDVARTKPMGLGSYWGAGLGGLVGAGLGLYGTARTGDLRFPFLGAGLGGALGGITGITAGKLLGNRASLGSEEAKKKYLNLYINAYAKEHDISPEEAADVIDSFRKANKPKLKPVQQGVKSMKGNIEKAAEFGANLGKVAGVSSAVARGLAHGARSASRESSVGEPSGEGSFPAGLGLGLGIGGLSGALYGAINPRKDEYYELDEKGDIKLDKKGVPKTYFENRSRLMEALRRASAGALIGGGLGVAVDAASR